MTDEIRGRAPKKPGRFPLYGTHPHNQPAPWMPRKARPKDTAVFFKPPGGGPHVTCCGWCGKIFKNLQAMGGHFTLHKDEPGYPVMPRPSEEALGRMKEDGYVEC